MKNIIILLLCAFSLFAHAQNTTENESGKTQEKEFTLRQKIFFAESVYIFKIDKKMHSNENILRGEVLKTFKDSMSNGAILDLKMQDNFFLMQNSKLDYLNSPLLKKEMNNKKMSVNQIEKDIVKNDVFLMIENLKYPIENTKPSNAYLYIGNSLSLDEINKKIIKMKEQDILPHQQSCNTHAQCTRIVYGCGGETSVNHALAPFIKERLYEKYGDPKALNCMVAKYNNDERNVWMGSSCVKNNCGIYFLNRFDR